MDNGNKKYWLGGLALLAVIVVVAISFGVNGGILKGCIGKGCTRRAVSGTATGTTTGTTTGTVTGPVTPICEKGCTTDFSIKSTNLQYYPKGTKKGSGYDPTVDYYRITVNFKNTAPANTKVDVATKILSQTSDNFGNINSWKDITSQTFGQTSMPYSYAFTSFDMPKKSVCVIPGLNNSYGYLVFKLDQSNKIKEWNESNNDYGMLINCKTDKQI